MGVESCAIRNFYCHLSCHPVMADGDGDGADSQLWNVSEWDHFDRGGDL